MSLFRTDSDFHFGRFVEMERKALSIFLLALIIDVQFERKRFV